MEKIILLTDYKGHFSSKWSARPYRSGMDKNLLKRYFKENGIEIEFMPLIDIDFYSNKYSGKYILFSSSEDDDLFYKSFVEDICLGLELSGAKLIPSYKFLKAHHNKVFMEIIRSISNCANIKNLKSTYYGTIEELRKNANSIKYPIVFKGASGATSTSVHLAHNKSELIEIAEKYSRTRKLFLDVYDYGRAIKRKGYIRESTHRRKFILQEFIPNLDRDWKILIFGNKYYILERSVRKNDFRASGSGILKYPDALPEGILDFAKNFFELCNLPFLSIDVAFNGNEYFLIEFQAIQFGTHALDTSQFYYINSDDGWKKVDGSSILEEEYVRSVIDYIK